MIPLLVVVDDLHIVGIPVTPDEADAVLIRRIPE
jgi:hypothetical protein